MNGHDDNAPSSSLERRGQSGISLIETLVAVMMIGLALLTLAGLLYATLMSSASHRARVTAATRATDIAEAIDDLIYLPCPAASVLGGVPYRAVLDVTPNRKFDERITGVWYLADGTEDNPVWNSGCPPLDQGAQRIAIRVTTRTQPVVSSDLIMVKRDDRCPSGVVGRSC